jgi:hypothetical protein
MRMCSDVEIGIYKIVNTGRRIEEDPSCYEIRHIYNTPFLPSFPYLQTGGRTPQRKECPVHSKGYYESIIKAMKITSGHLF